MPPPTAGEPAKPLTVGPVVLPNRVFLAPMSGVTDTPFRRLAARLGAGVVVSEMIASAYLAEGRRDAHRRVDGDGLKLNVVQIAGCEARWMAEGARMAVGAGAEIIDINMGCPARHVTNGESGSALMRDLGHALTLIEATVGAVEVPVTLKMRLGWDERSLNAPELARRAEAAGVQLITVHGRTRQQFYKGEANWSAVRAVKAAVDVPVVVNGDIKSADDAVRALRETGCAGVMVGRAAIDHPWIFREARSRLDHKGRVPAPTVAERFAVCREHLLAMTGERGERRGLRAMRRYYPGYLDRVPGAELLIAELNTTTTLGGTLDALDEGALAPESAAEDAAYPPRWQTQADDWA